MQKKKKEENHKKILGNVTFTVAAIRCHLVLLFFYYTLCFLYIYHRQQDNVNLHQDQKEQRSNYDV